MGLEGCRLRGGVFGVRRGRDGGDGEGWEFSKVFLVFWFPCAVVLLCCCSVNGSQGFVVGWPFFFPVLQREAASRCRWE